MTLLLLLLLAPFAAAGPDAPGLEPPAPTPLAPGITRVLDHMDQVPVHIVRIRPGAARWRFLRPPAPMETWRVDDVGGEDGPVVAVNGGYFDIDGSPMGLMVHEGRQLNPMRKADWGVFWLDRKGAGHLHHRRKFRWPKWTKKVDFAVECGPRIRVDGEAIQVRPGTARRTVVGVRGDGDLILAVFPARVGLRDAGRWLHARWAVKDLLNLDGGSSTQLALREGGQWLTLARGAAVPALIGLYPVVRESEEKD
jgi:hypothetical protein